MARIPVAGPVVIPNCVEVRLVWSNNGRTFKNVLHGNLTAAGPLNPTIAETLFSAFKTQLTSSSWGAMIHTTTTMTGVEVKDLRAGNNPTLLSTGAAAAGTGTGNASPLSTALVFTLKTAQSGRAFRGRAYLAGLAPIAIADSLHGAAAAFTNGIAFLNGVNSVMGTQGFPLVVAQRALQAGTDKHGNPLPARAAAVVPVTSINNVNNRLDSQRRRLGH